MKDHIFTIFDTETTGLNPLQGAKLVEIGAVKMRGGEILESEVFESLINPGMTIPMETFKVHGISDDMVKDAPSISDVLPNFLEFVGDTTLVAHNAEFDMAFVTEELFQLNPFGQPPRCLCTKLLSRRLRPQEKFHNLDTLTYRYGFPKVEEGRHRALTDVLMLAKVFQKLLEESNASSIDELFRLQ